MNFTLLGSPHEWIVGFGVTFTVLAIQRYSGKLSKRSQAKKSARLKKEYEDALYFTFHPEYLICRLILRCMGLLLYVAYILLLIIQHMYGGDLAESFPPPNIHGHWLVTTLNVALGLIQVLFIAATIFVVIKVKNSFDLSRRVHFLESYVTYIPDEIRNKSIEETALLIRDSRPLSALSYHDIEILSARRKTNPDDTKGDDPAEAHNTTANKSAPPSSPLT